jgi:hypothetical protein
VVAEITIDDEQSNQRSMIRSVTVTFDGIVDTPAAAFALTNLGSLASPSSTEVTGLIIERHLVGRQTIATITFGSGSSVIDRPSGNSLADGNYRLDINGSLITGTSNGVVMQSDYAMGDDEADDFFRLYGDSDGDGDVDFSDFASAFLPGFGLVAGASGFRGEMDYDGDSDIDFTDFSAGFLPNFGKNR